MTNVKTASTGLVESGTLPAFTDVIKVEVEVNSIFQKLMETFPEDYKHKENLAHAIVGTAVEKGGIEYIYNALNGYTNTVDFKVGDVIDCTEKSRNEWYDANKEREDGSVIKTVEPIVASDAYKPSWKKRKIAVGKAVVEEINLYKSMKLKISYKGEPAYNRGPVEDMEDWVNHKECTKWHVEVVA